MRSRSSAYPGENKWTGWLYVLPGLLVYAFFVFFPFLDTVKTSFYSWDGFSSNKILVGFQNYIDLFQDSQFLNALFNNFIFIIFYTIIPILIGLLLASLLTRKEIKGLVFFRTALFLPQIISMVVIGVIWRWMFNPTFGPINMALRAIGLDALTRTWLGDFTWALPSVGLIGSWVQYGFCMILFLAGMQHIPEEYYEAANLDGANALYQLIHVTIPGLRAEIGVALVSTIIAALRVFDLVYVTTRGGPGETTLVTGFLLYRTAFLQKRFGYATAIATLLTLLILIISLLIQRFQRQNEDVR